MAKAPPPEPIDHHYDIARLTKVFAITSLLVLPVFGWMTWQDYGRDWKIWQKKFVENDRKRTRAALDAAAAKIDPAAEANFLAKKREGARELRHNRAAVGKAEDRTRKAEGAWYLSDQDFRFQKAEMDTARYEFETAQKLDPKSSDTAKKQKSFEKLKADYDRSQIREQKTRLEWDTAKAELARLEKDKTDAEEALKKIDEDYDRYQAKLKTLNQSNAFYFVRNAPIADMLAPSLKIQQVQLDGLFNDVNFLKGQRVDRCMTCHMAADKRGFDDKELYPNAVLRTHPRLDVFVDSNSPHPYATFGCTSCHAGRDGATDFTRAGHMPDDFEEYEKLEHQLKSGHDEKGRHLEDPDALRETIAETQTGRWVKRYGWEIDKYNDLPMFPMKAVNAGCFRCHKSETNHVKAEHLDAGKKLIENLGCWGCHNMKGFENLPRVGPSLAALASKTTPEWTARWLSNPKAFRHNTRMPRFFYLENFDNPTDKKKTDTMIEGVVTYLFDRSARSTYGAAPSGDAEKGKLLFESVGCQGCHVSDPKAERHVMDGWRQHGPNLIGLREKTSPEWIAAWLRDPKKINPETRMPNLRLSEEEIGNLVAFLTTRPPSDGFAATVVPKADEGERDAFVFEYLVQSRTIVEAKSALAKMSAHEKNLFLGEKFIAHYGCYACHNVPGFDKAKPIGVELSEWGNKPIHLLDFGFVKIPDTRADWLHQKVHEPRSFDREKVKSFQEKLRMPQFSLSEGEMTAIQSTVLGMQKDDMADSLKAKLSGDRTVVEAGRRLVKEYNCQGCHILEERGGQIRETLPDIALAPPNIRGEGAKVQSDWLFAFVNAPKTGQIRPWLKVRMPTFEFSDDQLNTLTHYFASLEKARYPFQNPVTSLDAKSREAGARSFEAMKCFQCHPSSPEGFQKALQEGKQPADLAPILSAAHNRLRYDWINDWIKRPEEWMPGTRMPTNFPKEDEKTGKRSSVLAMAIDSPTYAEFKKQMIAIWGSEAEAKAFVADPDRVTKALRDHIWSLGNPNSVSVPPASGHGRPARAARSPHGKPLSVASR